MLETTTTIAPFRLNVIKYTVDIFYTVNIKIFNPHELNILVPIKSSSILY